MVSKTPSHLDIALGSFLRDKMSSENWSYSQLSKETKIPPSMLHGLINGNKFATLHLVARLMKSLRVDLVDIFPTNERKS